ncbi:MAG: phage/plasmid primase, P4 family [Pararhizobium sp.]
MHDVAKGSRTAKKQKASPRDKEVCGHTEINLADAFVRHYGDSWRYVAEWGKWLKWDGRVWRKEDTLAIDDDVKAYIGGVDDEEAFSTWRTVRAVRDLASSDRRIAATVEQWDAESFVLNTPDGIINLRTTVLSHHDPNRHCSKIAAVSPKAMETPLWDGFLDKIFSNDQKLIAYLYRVMGYCLTGDTREHALFFGYGTGGNGKSVFIETVSGILGDYATTAPISAFTLSHHDQHPTEIARLQGARLVVASETEEGKRWNEARVKQLTGGDRIAARYMRQDFFEFTPLFKLLIVGNHRPRLKTVDEAMRRRLQMIPFIVTISDEEKDKQLGRKLKPEWPGILHKIIQGGIDWQASGLSAPEAVTTATQGYFDDEDTFGEWMAECCEIGKGFEDTIANLYGSWRAFHDQNGTHASAKNDLSARLSEKGFEAYRGNRGRFFRGLKVSFIQLDDAP